MKLRVGIDLDGVLFNFGQSCKDYLDATSRGHLWKSGPTPAPFWDWYKDWGWTSQEFVDFCNAGVDEGYIFRGNVRDGAVAAMWEIKTNGHELIIITDRSFGSSPVISQTATKQWWKEEAFPDYDEIYFSPNKTIVPTDIFVEDKYENWKALIEAGTRCYLITRPWNETFRDVPEHLRLGDIIEFPKRVEAFATGRRILKSAMEVVEDVP